MVFAVSCGIEFRNCRNDPLYNLVSLVSPPLITMAVHCTDTPFPHYHVHRESDSVYMDNMMLVDNFSWFSWDEDLLDSRRFAV